MPATPPTTPNLGLPRFSATDAADFPTDANSIVDTLDPIAAKRGAIVDADIAPAAGIAKSKLAALAVADADIVPGAAIAKSKLAGLDVVDADVDPAAAIAETKLALATDAAPGTGSRRTLGTGANQAAAGNDSRFLGMAPIGTIIPYAGYGDPPEANWVIADGRLIDKTTYAGFFGRVGHVYNGGVDPGSNKVKIPDKRGRKSVGAINMGSSAGAGANDNAHAQAARGASSGEVNHTLSTTELAAHAHGLSDPSHAHSIADPQHSHGVGSVYPYFATAWPAWNWVNVAYTPGGYAVAYANAGNGAGTIQNAATGIGDYGAYTGMGMYNAGGGGGHNNLDPYEADCYLVRIA